MKISKAPQMPPKLAKQGHLISRFALLYYASVHQIECWYLQIRVESVSVVPQTRAKPVIEHF